MIQLILYYNVTKLQYTETLGWLLFVEAYTKHLSKWGMFNIFTSWYCTLKVQYIHLNKLFSIIYILGKACNSVLLLLVVNDSIWVLKILSLLGIILSQSSLKFQVDGTSVDNPFNIEQVIRYSECLYSPKNISTYRLKIARNFISYEAREKIIRYAMTNKVTPLGGKV